MDHWFTVEQIDSQTFAISEYKHWEETHCYLLCGRERAILIDTGLGVSNIKNIVDSLTTLPVMVVTTHAHWDHIGGHQYFEQIAVHAFEKDWLNLGGRKIRVIHTPGHSPGHCCFYEPERRYLFSGDLIYKGCLYAFYPTTNLQLFYRSVKRLQQYEIVRVLPGHHQLDISVSLINDIENGFKQLEEKGQLKQGEGLFEFGDFQIQI